MKRLIVFTAFLFTLCVGSPSTFAAAPPNIILIMADYPMSLPHWPFTPTPISQAWKDSSRRLEEDTAHFPDMVAYTDQIVGRLVKHVDDLGLRENTLIRWTPAIFYPPSPSWPEAKSRANGPWKAAALPRRCSANDTRRATGAFSGMVKSSL